VDDGSLDNSQEVMATVLEQVDCVRYLRLTRSFGEEVAISAGLDSVIGDFVVVMSIDGDPPALIPEFVEEARKGCDMVFGVSDRQKKSLLARLGSRLFHWYYKRVTGLEFPKNITQFRVYSRQALNALMQIKDRHRNLRFASHQIGFKRKSINYKLESQCGRAPGVSFFELVNTALNVVVSTSRHPLRFLAWLGVLASVLNLVYVFYILAVYLFKANVVEGWTTLSLQQAVMFFFLFIILGLLSEYIGHILEETKTRPQYYILEEATSSVMLADESRLNVVKESIDITES
jgi:glycosyltransferase involved in cell wall biosynthesis